MSRTYKKNIRHGVGDGAKNTEFYRLRRKQRRHRARHRIHNLLANRLVDNRSIGVSPLGWGMQIGWEETFDDNVIENPAPFVNRWIEPSDGHLLVNRDVLKKMDREKRVKEFAEYLHHKYDRYLKDKHRKHQGKPKKNRKHKKRK